MSGLGGLLSALSHPVGVQLGLTPSLQMDPGSAAAAECAMQEGPKSPILTWSVAPPESLRSYHGVAFHLWRERQCGGGGRGEV